MANIGEFLNWYGEMAWRDKINKSDETLYAIVFYFSHQIWRMQKSGRDREVEETQVSVFNDSIIDLRNTIWYNTLSEDFGLDDAAEIAKEFNGRLVTLPEKNYEDEICTTKTETVKILLNKTNAFEFIHAFDPNYSEQDVEKCLQDCRESWEDHQPLKF